MNNFTDVLYEALGRACNEDIAEQLATTINQLNTLVARVNELEAHNDELIKFTSHKNHCAKVEFYEEGAACDCGLRKLINKIEAEKKK